MDSFFLHSLTSSHIPTLMALQQRYADQYPGAPVIPGELYLSPTFHHGEDVLCASDADGRLLGYAVVYAQLTDGADSLRFWGEVRGDPTLQVATSCKASLWNLLLARAETLARDAPRRPIDLLFQYLSVEAASIAEVTSRGAHHTGSIYQMACQLVTPLTPPTIPVGLEVRLWRLESEADQRRFLIARNACFPDAPLALEGWQYFMQSSQWRTGALLAAFAGGTVVGGVLVFWDAEGNVCRQKQMGQVDTLFVLPAWRQRGLGRYLLWCGLDYLQTHGMHEAQLEVRARNASALHLYASQGFVITAESGVYELRLGANSSLLSTVAEAT